MPEAFKFLHAADFHLDRQIRGLAELPAHLKTKIAAAPYEAARNVFDAALAERVDFVLLCGDLFKLEASGPRPAAFLLGQFERLANKGIEVYWCSGNDDPIERWPASIELPANVQTFSSPILEDVTHRRDSKAIANIYGIGFDARRQTASDFITDADDVFPIAIAHGEFEQSTVPWEAVRYWALGGRHRSAKLEKPGSILAYPGTTQGRTPKETGAFGCHLCRVDTHGKLRVQFVETDTLRFMPQKVAIHESASRSEIEQVLSDRALKILNENGDRLCLVNWSVSTTGEFNPALRHREHVEHWLEWLRDEFGRGETGLWSTDFNIDPPSNVPVGWYEEDTILGEYLRAVGRYQSDDSLNLSLHEYLPASAEGSELENVARVSEKNRNATLQKAVVVGIEYLGAEKEAIES